MSGSAKYLRVLHIEDSFEDSQRVERCLCALNYRIDLSRISGKKSLKEALRERDWDLILSDAEAGGLGAADSFAIVRRTDPDVPFILVCHRVGEDNVADLLKSGIEDVVLKDRMERLSTVIRRALREHEMRTKEARAQRVANEAIAAKEQMLTIVSHDIKNPLGAIQLEVQSLLRATTRSDNDCLAQEVTLQGHRILKLTQRIKTLITDLLDQGKGDQGLTRLVKTDVEPANLFWEVADGCRSLIEEKKIKVLTSFPRQSVLVNVDRNKMYQVLSNLLGNALKFTPPGGEILFEVRDEAHDVVFSFQDTGKGLEKVNTRRLFEKYWTGRRKEGTGTGLGLFICKTVVEAHGGRILAENAQAGGARFSFNIPKVFDEDHPRPESGCSDHGPRIFVVDDDDDLREVMSWALGKEGYDVVGFKQPQEALRVLGTTVTPPGLILVDQYMEGMKGSEFLERVSEFSSIPAMIISGAPEEVGNLGHEVLAKPLDLEGLLGKVKRHFPEVRI